MKLTIISKRDYSLTGDDGRLRTGRTYGAFNQNGEALTFIQKLTEDGQPIKGSEMLEDHKVYRSEVGFNSERSKDINLEPQIFGKKVKYYEVLPE